jgi:hypothetical protein
MKATDRDKLRWSLANMASASHVLVGDGLAIAEWCSAHCRHDLEGHDRADVKGRIRRELHVF